MPHAERRAEHYVHAGEREQSISLLLCHCFVGFGLWRQHLLTYTHFFMFTLVIIPVFFQIIVFCTIFIPLKRLSIWLQRVPEAFGQRSSVHPFPSPLRLSISESDPYGFFEIANELLVDGEKYTST